MSVPDVPKAEQATHPSKTENKPKLSILGQYGWGALFVAVLFHAARLLIGAVWVFQIIQPVEKTVDFMQANGIERDLLASGSLVKLPPRGRAESL